MGWLRRGCARRVFRDGVYRRGGAWRVFTQRVVTGSASIVGVHSWMRTGVHGGFVRRVHCKEGADRAKHTELLLVEKWHIATLDP